MSRTEHQEVGSTPSLDVDHLEFPHEAEASDVSELSHVEIRKEALSIVALHSSGERVLLPLRTKQLIEVRCDPGPFVSHPAIHAIEHEVEQHFASVKREQISYQCQRHSRPPERVDERKCRSESCLLLIQIGNNLRRNLGKLAVDRVDLHIPWLPSRLRPPERLDLRLKAGMPISVRFDKEEAKLRCSPPFEMCVVDQRT